MALPIYLPLTTCSQRNLALQRHCKSHLASCKLAGAGILEKDHKRMDETSSF